MFTANSSLNSSELSERRIGFLHVFTCLENSAVLDLAPVTAWLMRYTAINHTPMEDTTDILRGVIYIGISYSLLPIE